MRVCDATDRAPAQLERVIAKADLQHDWNDLLSALHKALPGLGRPPYLRIRPCPWDAPNVLVETYPDRGYVCEALLLATDWKRILGRIAADVSAWGAVARLDLVTATDAFVTVSLPNAAAVSSAAS